MQRETTGANHRHLYLHRSKLHLPDRFQSTFHRRSATASWTSGTSSSSSNSGRFRPSPTTVRTSLCTPLPSPPFPLLRRYPSPPTRRRFHRPEPPVHHGMKPGPFAVRPLRISYYYYYLANCFPCVLHSSQKTPAVFRSFSIQPKTRSFINLITLQSLQPCLTYRHRVLAPFNFVFDA